MIFLVTAHSEEKEARKLDTLESSEKIASKKPVSQAVLTKGERILQGFYIGRPIGTLQSNISKLA